MNELTADEKSGSGRMRILLVAPTQPLIGGQVVQAEELLKNFAFEDSVRVDLQPTNPQNFESLQKIKYVRTLVVSAAYVFGLLKNIPSRDIVHVFSAGDTGFLISTAPAVFIAKLFGKKTILHYHHGGAREHLTNWRRTAPRIVKLFDKIVVPTEFLVASFAEFGLSAEPIFNIVDTRKFRFRMRENLRPVFLSNRNFDALYNVGCILRAFRIIQNEYPQAELIVAGDGEEREKLKRIMRDLKLENVEFTGRVSPAEMPKLYDWTDVYLNSSNVDNMPNSIIEAFAAGLPVVSTGAGGIPYIVENGETGLLVEKNDDEALAAAALRILNDENSAKKIITNSRRECVKYSWANVREKWLELYTALANQ